jgi:hypothetical protein
MFDFLFMSGNHKEREVRNTELDDGTVIDTCAVLDTNADYETGIASKYYNDGKWIIVEEYETKKATAIAGHQKWVSHVKTELDILTDVSQSTFAQMAKSVGYEGTFERKEVADHETD